MAFRKDHFADFSSFAPPSAVDGLLVVEHNEAGFQERFEKQLACQVNVCQRHLLSRWIYIS